MHKLYIFMMLFCFLVCFSLEVKGQHTLTGRVTDGEGHPLAFVTVVLHSTQDSTLIRGDITNEVGHFVFEHLETGTYRIAASMVGYEAKQPQLVNLLQGVSRLTVPDIVLNEGLGLEKVIITSTKPLYELRADRMVMNIGAYPSMSGNTGLELQQKTPGIIVNRQSNSIGMGAKGEVLVMINNKIQRVPAEVLFAQLQGMRSENIERIELIHQPPARYDASGAAGIIHIVLKKNKQQGTNGSMSLMGGYGQREKAGLSLNLNSRRGKFNWYGDYNFNYDRANNFEINHFREYEFQGDRYYYENFVVLRNHLNRQHTANFGLDLDFDGRTVIGLLLGGAMSSQVWTSGGESKSFAFINDEPIGEAGYLIGSVTDMASYSANLNLLQKIGESSQLDLDLDYTKIRYDNSGNVLNTEEDPEHAIFSDRSTPMEFWIAQLDMVNQLVSKWKIITGAKGTFNNTLNTTSIQSISNDYWSDSDLFPEEEKIKEQILAAHISFTGELSEKLSTELGVRYEHYTYQLEQAEQENFKREFKNPFPVFRLNYKIDSLNTIQLGLNRSITRPNFSHLTSFFVMFDPSLVVYANPQLMPTFTNNYKITWQKKSTILSLSYLKNIQKIYFHNTVDKENHLQISVPRNLDREDLVEASLSFPLFPAHWWEINWNLATFYQRVMDESSRAQRFEDDIINYSVQFNSIFKLGKDWTASLDGRYISRYLSGDQWYEDHPYLNFGIRKKFPSGSSLSLTLQDMTNSIGKRKWEYHQPGLEIRTFGRNDFSERQVRITYTFLFGNHKLPGKRERETGAEEVKSRM